MNGIVESSQQENSTAQFELSALPGTHLRIYIRMCELRDTKGIVEKTHPALAADLGLNTSTVDHIMPSLVKTGLITKLRGTGRANVYRVTPLPVVRECMFRPVRRCRPARRDVAGQTCSRIDTRACDAGASRENQFSNQSQVTQNHHNHNEQGRVVVVMGFDQITASQHRLIAELKRNGLWESTAREFIALLPEAWIRFVVDRFIQDNLGRPAGKKLNGAVLDYRLRHQANLDAWRADQARSEQRRAASIAADRQRESENQNQATIAEQRHKLALDTMARLSVMSDEQIESLKRRAFPNGVPNFLPGKDPRVSPMLAIELAGVLDSTTGTVTACAGQMSLADAQPQPQMQEVL